jgi:hypothetical protein
MFNMAHMSRMPKPATPPNPADLPPVSFDNLVHQLTDSLGLTVNGVIDVAGVRSRVEEKLKWWQVFRHSMTAQYFPVTPEAPKSDSSRGFAYIRFRVAHAIATRTLARYGPKNGIQLGLVYVGSYAFEPRDDSTNWAEADLWIDVCRVQMMLVYSTGDIEKLPLSRAGDQLVSVARRRYLVLDTPNQPIMPHGPWKPMRLSSAGWCTKLHADTEAISSGGWGPDSPLGPMSWCDGFVTLNEFNLRRHISEELARGVVYD